MRLGGLVRFALGGLWRQKVRTGLTVAGVAVGACGLAFSLALGIGLREFIDREFKGRPAFWTVHVHPGGGKPVAEADIPPEITLLTETCPTSGGPGCGGCGWRTTSGRTPPARPPS